ncbi:MAG TPA: peptide chain release factor N(5)-glutamine methyltransferase [Geobacteraceae bacterium]
MTKQTETWTTLKVLEWTKGYLAEKGVGNARLEAEWMLCEILGLDRVGLYVNFDKPLTAAELAHFRGMVARRARREPLQYILGTQEFMGLDFEVAPGVLIPRHDTETLVEEAVRRGGNARKVLDIGAGSGCIAVALARLLPDAEVAGVERSPAALNIARRNAERHGVAVDLREGSLFEPLAGERFDLIVSNPPYIPTADLAGLQPEVRDFEPTGALDGGPDGLDFYRLIIPAAPDHLNPGGWLLFEVGIGQAEQVLGLFGTTGRFGDLFTAKDPGGIERVVGGRLL